MTWLNIIPYITILNKKGAVGEPNFVNDSINYASEKHRLETRGLTFTVTGWKVQRDGIERKWLIWKPGLREEEEGVACLDNQLFFCKPSHANHQPLGKQLIPPPTLFFLQRALLKYSAGWTKDEGPPTSITSSDHVGYEAWTVNNSYSLIRYMQNQVLLCTIREEPLGRRRRRRISECWAKSLCCLM